MSYPPPPPPFPGQPQPQYAAEPPLSQPYYGAPFRVAFARFWRKYFVFSGRASRAEYWWWLLFSLIVGFVLSAFTHGKHPDGGPSGLAELFNGIVYLWGLATVIPGLALFWRRLHDSNHSGWWILIGLIPLVGEIILLVFLVSGPQAEGARFDR